MKNITLAVEEGILEQVKLAAAEQRTTVNGMVREFFEAVAAKRRAKDEAREALLRLAREAAGDMGGKQWNREALYDR
ncbi:hypothetical protein FJ987_25575 [Mesorhizobium sp. CU2]|uniref:hypothetical protein n=1 Tax=unclassified Mesorhizobium TaxID=325217 RepID=UPI001129DB4E|nr:MULTISPECIES: hypothetical protein [unclassified Mesorhizobium]TPN83709.1 hypothetical protein FJ988_13070 [Mesorhizobium sp. CU3]TPO05978.1 hypothetical protein FJ987_25575 [Mesorhizobium sp. CU2]